ncbi:MAG: DUF5011 domain-containing protein [Bacilli bacterium]|nr:DUF5011 domain-containing protein [Bacilli bacterium]
MKKNKLETKNNRVLETIKKNKVISILIVTILLILVVTSSILEQKYKNAKTPSITLLGDSVINLKIGEKYKEPGATADDGKGNNITDDIKITGVVDVNKKGVYYIYYNVENKYRIKANEIIRVIKIGESDKVPRGQQQPNVELRSIIEEVVEKYKNNLGQFGEDNCKKVDYLSPMILDYFKDTEEPIREELRPLVRTVLTEKGL